MLNSRRLLPLLLSLLLVFGQQAAFAHLLGHSGLGNQHLAQHEDQGHAAADALAQGCSTCVAFAALHGTAPTSHAAPLLHARFSLAAPKAAAVAVVARALPTARARGPPAHSEA